MKEFLTFQWLLYRVNNISADPKTNPKFDEDIPEHKKAMIKLKSIEPGMADEVEKFQKNSDVNYLKALRKEIFKM